MVNLTRNNTTIKSKVADFYAGKCIFVSGGTGFVGKVLVEKLLYSCTDIDKIYLLIRGKENSSSTQRIQELIDKPIFDRIKKICPQSLDKLVPVSGDITENNLGLKTEDEKSLLEKVSVVFHSAATVRFNERLDIAVSHNLEATKKLLKLSHRMNNLESLVFMSTAFISPQNQYLDEVAYPSPVGAKELQAFLDQRGMDNEEELTMFLRGRPNTYTFTKSLAESYVATNHGSIPTAIIRPSIVVSAVSEPMPGWIDTWSAAAAIVATTSLGYNRVIVGKGDNHIDLIPVDYVTNLAIVAASTSAKKNNENKLDIYNSCTSSCNPLTIKEMLNIIRSFTVKNGFNDLPLPFTVITKDGIRKEIASFLLEKLPAMIADMWISFKGKKPRYVKLQSRLSSNRELVNFFTSRSYNMSADKTIALSRSLSESDARLFPFNPQEINWKQYLPVYCRGIRKFLLRK